MSGRCGRILPNAIESLAVDSSERVELERREVEAEVGREAEAGERGPLDAGERPPDREDRGDRAPDRGDRAPLEVGEPRSEARWCLSWRTPSRCSAARSTAPLRSDASNRSAAATSESTDASERDLRRPYAKALVEAALAEPSRIVEPAAFASRLSLWCTSTRMLLEMVPARCSSSPCCS